MAIEEFETPRETLLWAKEETQQAYNIFKEYLDTRPVDLVDEIDPKSGHIIYKYKLNRELPILELSKHANSALNHAKNGYDQILYAARAAIGKLHKNNRSNNFPWTDSLKAFDKDLLNKEIPEIYHESIRKLHPYFITEPSNSFSNYFRQLSLLANRKHSVGVRTIATVTSAAIPNVKGNISYAQSPKPHWDCQKNEMVVLEVSPDAIVTAPRQDAFHLEIAILDDSKDYTIGHIPVGKLFWTYIERAETLSNELENIAIREKRL